MILNAAHIIILIVTGSVAGFAGGMLGLGGAFLMGPVQYMVYSGMGMSPDLATKLAFGTNMLVVLTIGISSAWRHNLKGVVVWKLALVMGSCALIGSFGGATAATHLPGQVLRTVFGAINLLAAVRMFIGSGAHVTGEPESRPVVWAAWALPVGFLTGLIGIGGGVMVVPIIALVFRYTMRQAVATSLAAMILTSIGGVIGYLTGGLGVAGLPAYTIGYISLQSWVFLAVPSIVMAQVGAVVSHRISERLLRYIFAVIMVFMGLKMIGVFELMGLPF